MFSHPRAGKQAVFHSYLELENSLFSSSKARKQIFSASNLWISSFLHGMETQQLQRKCFSINLCAIGWVMGVILEIISHRFSNEKFSVDRIVSKEFYSCKNNFPLQLHSVENLLYNFTFVRLIIVEWILQFLLFSRVKWTNLRKNDDND